MDLATLEMGAEQAQEAFREYRDAVRSQPKAKLDDAQREYEEMDRAVLRGYKELAKGHHLLKLTETIRAGGTEQRAFTGRRWRNGDWRDVNLVATFPRLAVCRADARECICSGVHADGSVRFYADGRDRKADTVRVEGAFDAGEGRSTSRHRAIVPTIPPPFRPPHKLSGYHLLWEAEWDRTAPLDPALLKHLGGDLYAVLAIWDLTELERAVLGGRA